MSSLERVLGKFRATMLMSTDSLGWYRILFGTWILLKYRSKAWIGDVPPTLFDPPLLSLANLFDRFPPKGFFVALDVFTVVAAALLLVGYRTRIAGLLLALCMIVGNSFQFSFGKIDHSIMPACVLIVLSFCPWGEIRSVDAWRRRKAGSRSPQWADLTVLGVLIAFGFFTAGYGKALVWLDFNTSTGGFLSWLISCYYVADRTLLLADWAVHMPWPRLWEVLDVGGVIFELGFFWALFKRRRWTLWIAIWCAFHLLNTLLLNIAFEANAIIVMAFVPWVEVLKPGVRWSGLARVGMALVGAGVIALTALGRIPDDLASGLFQGHVRSFVLINKATIWAGLLLIFVREAAFPIVPRPEGGAMPGLEG